MHTQIGEPTFSKVEDRPRHILALHSDFKLHQHKNTIVRISYELNKRKMSYIATHLSNLRFRQCLQLWRGCVNRVCGIGLRHGVRPGGACGRGGLLVPADCDGLTLH